MQLKVKCRSENATDGKHIHIGGKDEIVFQFRAEVAIPARGVDVEGVGDRGIDGEVESHRQTHGIETGPKVRGGRRQAEMQGLALRVGGHAGWGWFLCDSLM